jgi:hypothetical protein
MWQGRQSDVKYTGRWGGWASQSVDMLFYAHASKVPAMLAILVVGFWYHANTG